MTDSPSFPLRGKVILQFGGTGVLGSALISSLGRAGAAVVVATRRRGSLRAVARAERAAGRSIEVAEVDIQSEKSLRALGTRVLRAHGRVDGLVFNAVSRPMRRFDDRLQTWKTSMEINATGLFATLRCFGDIMAEAGVGSMVTISSHMGSVGMCRALYGHGMPMPPPDYFFHKAGAINLARYLAAHYGPMGVRVNALSPGGIRAPGRTLARSFQRRYAARTMLGRMAEAHEIAGPAVFLLSDASSYITGANLMVDGGYTAM